MRADPLAVGMAGHERWRSEHTPAVVAARLDRAIRAGRVADPMGASPLYGRAPNARKPA